MARCKKCSYVLRCNQCECNACGFNGVESSAPQEEKTPDNEPKNKMPSVFQQAKNFAKATSQHVRNGGRSVPEHVKQSRLDVCSGCEYLSSDRCSKCGCFVKIKAAWASERCPIGKWEGYEATKGKCGGCGRK